MKINPFFKLQLNHSQQIAHTIGQKIKFFIYSYFFALAIMFFTLLFVTMPMDFFIMKVLHFESMARIMDPLKDTTKAYPFYLVVFIAPFFEEILFRLGLIINNKNISLFLGVLVFIFIGGSILSFTIENSNYIYFSLVGLAVSMISYFYFPKQILIFLNKHKSFIIYFSILSFGFLHITNASVYHWQLTIFYPFFVLPQLIMGYFITNLRLKYGFFWGLALHVIFNAISYL